MISLHVYQHFRTTQRLIKQIAEMSRALLTHGHGRSSEAQRVDLIMAANVQTALATKVQDLSALFRKKQTAYLRQLKGNESKASGNMSPDPLASLAEDEAYVSLPLHCSRVCARSLSRSSEVL